MSLKNILEKIVASIIAVYMIAGNFAVTGIGLNEVIAEDAIIPKITIDTEATRYVQYNQKTETGAVLQTNIEIGEDVATSGHKQITKTEVEVKVPEIDGVKPERVTITKANTKLTDGGENVKINPSYSKDTGLLTFSYGNENATNVENTKDEFEITYIYSEQAYKANKEQVKMQIKVTAGRNYKIDNSTATGNANITQEIIETENTASLINFDTVAISDIYKGYMYCNEENKTNYDTNYKNTVSLSVLNSAVTESTEISLGKSKFTKSDKTLINTELVEYLSTKVSETEFYNLLGQDGYINFYINDEQDEYATIRYSEADKKGNRTYQTVYNVEGKESKEAGKVEYASGVKVVRIVFSKPQIEGNIKFENQKTIRASKSYGEQVKNIAKIVEYANVFRTFTENAEETEFYNKTVGTLKDLKEPTTQMSLELSNDKLSTLSTNNITTTIKLNDTNGSCKLVQSGTIELTLPKNITATITNIKSLYENGITIKNAKIENGKVKIEITGKQTAYDISNVSGGVNIVLNLQFDIEDTEATHRENINLSYRGETISKEIEINSIGELLILSKINNETIFGSKTYEIGINEEKKTNDMEISIVNNYGEEIQDVEIKGTIGYKGEEAESTFNPNLKEIRSDKGEVQYSIDGQNWSTKNISNAKYFRIDVKDLKKEESIKGAYKIEIPEKLGYNQASYIKYEVTYKNKEQKLTKTTLIGFVTEVLESKNISVDTTEQNNAQLIVDSYVQRGLDRLENKDVVYEGEILTYKTVIKNKADYTIGDITIKGTIPEGTTYTKLKSEAYIESENWLEENTNILEVTKSDITLKPGEEAVLEYQVRVNNIGNVQTREIKQNNYVINNDESKYQGELISIAKVAKAEINMKFLMPDSKLIYTGETIEVSIKLKNLTSTQIQGNLRLDFNNSENISDVKYIVFTDDGDEHEINPQNISLFANETIYIKANIYIKDINNKDFKLENLEVVSNFKINNTEYKSNLLSRNIVQSKAFLRTALKGYINDKEIESGAIIKNKSTVVYRIDIENVGEIDAENITIKDILPEGLFAKNIRYDQYVKTSNNKYTTNNINEILDDETSMVKNEYIPAGKTLTIYLTCYFDMEDINELKNSIQIINNDDDENAQNIELNYKIEQEDEDMEPEDPMDEDVNNDDTSNNNDNINDSNENNVDNLEKSKYSISGVAWLDTNRNGKRDNTESLISGVNVSLINKQTGKLLADSEGNIITIMTSEDGSYKFENIEKGIYLVIFEFDTNTYAVTTYQKNEVDTKLNSDAIINNVSIDGNTKLLAITDNLDVSSNLNNIDIGLIQNAKFDLKLDKVISNIKVINEKGTKTKEYKNANIAKVDLVAKYMNDTSVIITYKFIITNNGDVTGYADKLVDNLPSGLSFSSELNKDWYKGNDGDLYNDSLSEVAIEPGNTKEVELVLTKETTEETTGTFSNSATLLKISNIEAIDEEVGAIEDNKSSADTIISIKTGSPFVYFGITVGSLAIIAVAAYIMKRKVLNKGI